MLPGVGPRRAEDPRLKEAAENAHDFGIQAHVSSDLLRSARVCVSNGRVCFNGAAMPAARGDWKSGERDEEPENDAHNSDKLCTRMEEQLHAGAMPTETCHRPSTVICARRLVAQRLKLKNRAERVSAADMREAAEEQ